MCGLWPELFFCDSDAAGLCHPLRTLGAVAEGQKPPLFSSFSPSFSFILLFWTNAIENGSSPAYRLRMDLCIMAPPLVLLVTPHARLACNAMKGERSAATIGGNLSAVRQDLPIGQ